MFSLDEFFRVSKEVNLPASPTHPEGETITIRVLSDAEMQERSEYAISEQIKVQDSLRDPESDLYRLKILPLMDATDEGLIETLVEIRRVDMTREASDAFPLNIFVYPDDANDEEKIKTQILQKEHEASVYGLRVKYITEGEKAHREKVSSLTREQLMFEAKFAATRVYVLKAQIEAELYYTVARSCLSNGKQRWTIEQVKNLPGKVIDFLMRQYHEVDRVDPWELTKSLQTGDAVGVESSS